MHLFGRNRDHDYYFGLLSEEECGDRRDVHQLFFRLSGAQKIGVRPVCPHISVPTFPIAGQITGPDVITVQPETLGQLARGRK